MASDRPVPVLLLDIDGTVRQGKDDPLGRFVNGPEDEACADALNVDFQWAHEWRAVQSQPDHDEETGQ